jgi:transcriptional regulator with XRE-family HTH domain
VSHETEALCKVALCEVAPCEVYRRLVASSSPCGSAVHGSPRCDRKPCSQPLCCLPPVDLQAIDPLPGCGDVLMGVPGTKENRMTDAGSPIVARRRLRSELRTARNKAGLTQDQVVSEMDWSMSKIIRIEAGSVTMSTSDLKALLPLYKITDPKRTNELIELARAARESSWAHEYRDVVTSQFLRFVEYEDATSIRREFDNVLVPGLLQTEEYAEIAIHQYTDRATAKKVKRLVEIRLKRQELLIKPTGQPLLFFILDEPVVHRHVGSTDLMRRQIHHLIELAEGPQVTIEIIPFSAGAHPAMERKFVTLEFPDAADDDVLYLESALSEVIVEQREEVLRYREAFEQLRKISLGPDNSVSYLKKLITDLR